MSETVPHCFWLFQTTHDCTLLPLTLRHCFWLRVTVPDCVWLFLNVCDCPWLSSTESDCPLLYITVPCSVLLSLTVTEYPYLSLSFRMSQTAFVFQAVPDCPRIPLTNWLSLTESDCLWLSLSSSLSLTFPLTVLTDDCPDCSDWPGPKHAIQLFSHPDISIQSTYRYNRRHRYSSNFTLRTLKIQHSGDHTTSQSLRIIEPIQTYKKGIWMVVFDVTIFVVVIFEFSIIAIIIPSP